MLFLEFFHHVVHVIWIFWWAIEKAGPATPNIYCKWEVALRLSMGLWLFYIVLYLILFCKILNLTHKVPPDDLSFDFEIYK